MKLLTRIFYDILLKVKTSKLQDFEANNKVLKTYFEPQCTNNSILITSLGAYFNAFYNFCFELNLDNMLKGRIKFIYLKLSLEPV